MSGDIHSVCKPEICFWQISEKIGKKAASVFPPAVAAVMITSEDFDRIGAIASCCIGRSSFQPCSEIHFKTWGASSFSISELFISCKSASHHLSAEEPGLYPLQRQSLQSNRICRVVGSDLKSRAYRGTLLPYFWVFYSTLHQFY